MPAQTPDPAQWFIDLLAAQQAMLRLFGTVAGSSDAQPAMISAVMPWLQAAGAVAAWQQEALKQATAWWSGAATGRGAMPGGAVIPDRRVAAARWRQDPRFDGLMRAYRAQSALLRKTLEAAPLDERSKTEWGFVLRQVIDALSPANYLATNPEALHMALESGGASLVQGMRLFLQDFAKGRVLTTDETAFEVGRNLATTPGSVVFENELIQLMQYALEHGRCARAAAADRTSVRQQVLHPRPATRQLLRRPHRGAGTHRVPGVVAQRRAATGPAELGRLSRRGHLAGDRCGADHQWRRPYQHLGFVHRQARCWPAHWPSSRQGGKTRSPA
jgi:hypothetical protein